MSSKICINWNQEFSDKKTETFPTFGGETTKVEDFVRGSKANVYPDQDVAILKCI